MGCRWLGGVVVVDGGWTYYYVTYSFLWCIPVPLAIFFAPLVLQRTTSNIKMLFSGDVQLTLPHYAYACFSIPR